MGWGGIDWAVGGVVVGGGWRKTMVVEGFGGNGLFDRKRAIGRWEFVPV